VLRYYAVYKDGSRHELKGIFSAVTDCDISVPADSLRIIAEYSRETAVNAYRISAEYNGQTVFRGIIDSVISERKGGAETMKICARSMAALLLDNEAEPLDYNNPSVELMYRRHLQPFDISLADGGKNALNGRLRINKGMSHWQVVEWFCMLEYGCMPKITASGTAYFQGLPKDETVSFGDGDGKTGYFSLTERRNPYTLVSEVRVKTAKNRGYRSVVLNSNPDCASVIKQRYVDISADNRSSETAYKMIEYGNRKSYVLQLQCFGCHIGLLGKRAKVYDSALGTLGGLCVRGVKFSEDKNGAVSLITLEKEWS